MDIFDNEKKIIEYFQSMVSTSEVALFPQNDEMEQVFLSIYDEELWGKWVDTSGKNDPPPDFYCDEYGLMMDVMRIDITALLAKKASSLIRHFQEKAK